MPVARIERVDTTSKIYMDLGISLLNLRILVIPVREDPKWTGSICPDCMGNVFTISWITEVQPFLSSADNNYFVSQKDVCVQCDDLVQTAVDESTLIVRTIYGDT